MGKNKHQDTTDGIALFFPYKFKFSPDTADFISVYIYTIAYQTIGMSSNNSAHLQGLNSNPSNASACKAATYFGIMTFTSVHANTDDLNRTFIKFRNLGQKGHGMHQVYRALSGFICNRPTFHTLLLYFILFFGLHRDEIVVVPF